jgi:membrane peptidoglycan carboxypeptidase
VLLSPRQPGSSFKPYVYAAALRDHAITLCTQLLDTPKSFAGYTPLDFDNSFMGTMTARKALVLSRNVPAVEVAQTEGIGKVIQLAGSMGIHSKLDPVLSTAIGGSDITMFEQVQGYQVLADSGTKIDLHGIASISDTGGRPMDVRRQPAGSSEVLSPAVAYLLADVLKDYQRQWSLGFTRRMASKSGTSGGSQPGVHPDAWMMAYDPGIVVGAWAGNTGPNGRGGTVSAFGVDVGSTMMADFVNHLPGPPPTWYQQPDGVASTNGELLLQGTQPSGGCARAAQKPADNKPADHGGQQVDLKGTLSADATIAVQTASGPVQLTLSAGTQVDGHATQAAGGLIVQDLTYHGQPPPGSHDSPIKGAVSGDMSVSIDTRNGNVTVLVADGDQVDGNGTLGAGAYTPHDIHIHGGG